MRWRAVRSIVSSVSAVAAGAEVGSSLGISLLGLEPPVNQPESMVALENKGRQARRTMLPVTSTERTTEEIVKELKQGRDWEENFELLYKRYFERVLRFILSLSRGKLSREDGEELTNDVFLAVWQGLSRLRDEAKFGSFLLRMAKHMCLTEIDRRGAGKRAPDYDHDSLELVSPDRFSQMANPEMTAQRHELRKRVLAALQEMPPQRRRCMKLYLEELTIRELADLLELQPGTVKANLHEARQYLQERLGPDFADSLRRLSDSDG